MSLLEVVTYTGIFVFALAGAFKARGSNLDVFGGLVVAFVSAYGGGTLRDLLIGRMPVNWVNNNLAFALILGGTAVTFLVKDKVNNFRRTIFFTDAIGLGLYTAAGIQVSQAMGINDLYSLIMGVITATFGGLIADILCGIPPMLLRRGELYATVCLIGGLFYIGFQNLFNMDPDINLTLCVILVVFIRIYSKRKD